jgi:catechol 2,3-dioxygenase-like lactoylglutathione lyase family enzyme
MMPHTPVLGNLSPLIPAGSDVEATLAFYVHKLGFTTIHKDGEPTEMAIMQRDAVEIFLCRNDDRYVAAQTSFRIHVQHVEQLYGEYQAQGVIHPDGQLTTKPWGNPGVCHPRSCGRLHHLL